MSNTAFVILLCFAFRVSNALQVGPFENLTSGIWDAWNAASSENVKQGRFAMVHDGNDTLYLVSRRLHRTAIDQPWDPASRGGIVSALDISTKTWTHKSYERLAEDKYAEEIFATHGRLFMITYYFENQKIVYGKLFMWNKGQQGGKWIEVTLKVEPAPTPSGMEINVEVDIKAFAVHVPNPADNKAYFVTSLHGRARGGSRIEYSTLTVQIGNAPSAATLKFDARKKLDDPSAVIFIATHAGSPNVLYSFVNTFLSEGYESETQFAYTLDLKTKKFGVVNFTGDAPPMRYDRMFTTANGELVLAGGVQFAGLGHTREVFDIWSLKLTTGQWRSTNKTIPEDIARAGAAYDKKSGKFYLAGLKEGVSVAKIT